MGITLYVATNKGTLELIVTGPDGANISGVVVRVDGDRVHIKTPRDEVSVRVGEHTLEVSKDGFETETPSFVIRRNGREEIHVALRPRSTTASPPIGPMSVKLTFQAGTNIPGTVKDKYGHGTGFTDRLPGTGGLIPTSDPNLDMTTNPGRLTIHSTPDWAGPWTDNPVKNPATAEAVGIFLPDPGTSDLTICVGLRNVDLEDWSDQLGIYVATTAGGRNVLQGSLHMELQWENGPPGLRQYYLTGNFGCVFATPTPYPPKGTPGIWENGDDINLTLSRTKGTWKMSWEDLTKGTSGNSDAYAIDWMNNQGLHVGIYYVNPRSRRTKTSTIEYLSASVGQPVSPAPDGVSDKPKMKLPSRGLPQATAD